ncbi:hypothetical protein K2Q00_00895 [Patescibacteria group bacterium]|nr:hypothetical protein [Patescibacteria group bacterium]
MQSNIEKQVMAGVAVVYTVRKLTSRFAIECYALALSFAGAAYFVSLPNVFQNLTHVTQGGVVSVGVFFLTAVLQTKLAVQVALFVAAASLVLMGVDVARSAATPTRRFA